MKKILFFACIVIASCISAQTSLNIKFLYPADTLQPFNNAGVFKTGAMDSAQPGDTTYILLQALPGYDTASVLFAPRISRYLGNTISFPYLNWAQLTSNPIVRPTYGERWYKYFMIIPDSIKDNSMSLNNNWEFSMGPLRWGVVDFRITGKAISGVPDITSASHHTVAFVRYFTLTGQLYGQYREEQRMPPNIPLIEEVVYTDNTCARRCVVRLN